MCVWSGFALGGIYGSQIVKGQFNLVMSLFGIPFVLGTLFLGSMAVMSVCGKVIVSVDRDGEGQVFTGVGMIGWTRRFHWASMTAVEEAPVDRNRFPFNGFSISIIGQSRLKFGTMLSEPVRFYLIQSLRYLLLQRL